MVCRKSCCMLTVLLNFVTSSIIVVKAPEVFTLSVNCDTFFGMHQELIDLNHYMQVQSVECCLLAI